MQTTELQERIAQWRKMATDDPENDLAHYRLAQLLIDDGQLAEACRSLARTIEINPRFSKAYQTLGECHMKLGDSAAAIGVFTKGFTVASEHGDRIPGEAMKKHLTDLGAPIPSVQASSPEDDDSPGTGFVCERPGCVAGKRARQLEKPPLPDELGQRIFGKICRDCWNGWFKDYSVKVINELRLDLSTEQGSAEYDKHMLDYLGFEQE